MGRLWVIGDAQGHLAQFRAALERAALIDADDRWTGADAVLAVLGDLVDRGPDGVGVIRLLRRLQPEASQQGGRVLVVLGNHDVLLLAARRFGGPFRQAFSSNGGQDRDLAELTDVEAAWLADLPAVALEQDHLLVHADAPIYLEYGQSIPEVNAAFRQVLHSADARAWQRLLQAFTQHRVLLAPGGAELLARYLTTFGGRRLVHGHSPISRTTHQPPETVTEPLVYLDGRCLNVDPGIYLGGPGFCYAAT